MRLLLTLSLFMLVSVLPASALDLNGTCEVAFHGSSTLHDFDGSGKCKPFTLTLAEDGMIQPAELGVPVDQMNTANDSRDEKMREMFDSTRHPEIVGRFAGGSLAELRSRVQAALQSKEQIPLQVKIRDIEAPVQATVTQLIDSEKTFSLDLEFPVSLKAYQLEAPSVLGLIRVSDEVRVHVSLHLPALPAQ